jgi:hypothetical protein
LTDWLEVPTVLRSCPDETRNESVMPIQLGLLLKSPSEKSSKIWDCTVVADSVIQIKKIHFRMFFMA